jgi:hypothetical protein
MSRRSNTLNIKATLNWVQETCTEMLERDGKYDGGLVLAPIDRHNLAQIKLVVSATLRKHAEKQTRKDIYIGA